MIAPVLGRKPACTCVYDARSASRLLVCSQRARQSSTAPSPPSSLHYSSLAQAATSSSHSSMHCWSSCWQAPSKALWCCLCYCPFSSLRRTWPCGRLQRKGRRMAGAAHQHLRTVQGCNQWTTAVVQSLLLVKGQTRRQQRTPERPEGSSMRARAWCARAGMTCAETSYVHNIGAFWRLGCGMHHMQRSHCMQCLQAWRDVHMCLVVGAAWR